MRMFLCMYMLIYVMDMYMMILHVDGTILYLFTYEYMFDTYFKV